MTVITSISGEAANHLARVVLAMPFVQDRVEFPQFIFQFEVPANQRRHRNLRHLRKKGLWIVHMGESARQLYGVTTPVKAIK